MDDNKTFLRALMAIGFVLLAGTVGYMVIEGWTVLDSLYMTVITITTIGFEEVHQLSPAGEAFTLFIIFIGLGIVAYSLLHGTRLLVEGEVDRILSRRRRMKAIKKMKDHFVICGFGRMGAIVCSELQIRGIPFVIVENKTETQDRILDLGYLMSPGDATEEQVLIDAGIERARGLVSLLDSDAQNVYVVLTARQINPDLQIIARAGHESAYSKLKLAGANRVISPYQIGGMRLVMGILKPAVMGFLEVAMDYSKMDVEIEEIRLADEAPYVGRRLVDTDIRKNFNLIIIAIAKPNGATVFNPGPQTVLELNDTLITMGVRSDLELFQQIAGESS